MARKVLNRRDLRAANDAAEAADVDAVKDVTVKKAPKKAVKRKSRTKVAKEVRLKAFWASSINL